MEITKKINKTFDIPYVEEIIKELEPEVFFRNLTFETFTKVPLVIVADNGFYLFLYSKTLYSKMQLLDHIADIQRTMNFNRLNFLVYNISAEKEVSFLNPDNDKLETGVNIKEHLIKTLEEREDIDIDIISSFLKYFEKDNLFRCIDDIGEYKLIKQPMKITEFIIYMINPSKYTKDKRYKKYYYIDGADDYLLEVFKFGLFGVQHFKHGNKSKGLLYLLTLGGFGLGYISELFKLITGSYSFTDEAGIGYIYEPLVKKKRALLVLICGFMLALIASTLSMNIYTCLLKKVIQMVVGNVISYIPVDTIPMIPDIL